MKITWYMDDGYAGPERPQTVEVDDDELASCWDDGERMMLIEGIIEEAFLQRGWFLKGDIDFSDLPDPEDGDEYQGPNHWDLPDSEDV